MSSLSASKSQFTAVIGALRWASTTGLRFGVNFWFSKQPMFWMPAGWLPRGVERLLAFPRAPTGSVSINVWAIACASVIAMIADAVAAGYRLTTERGSTERAERSTASPQAGDEKQGLKEL